jgi:integrase/recombinase XerD
MSMIDDTIRYLRLRSLLGYVDSDLGRDLDSFAKFAADRGATHLRTSDALAWVSLKAKLQRRHDLLAAIRRLGLFLNAEDSRHQIIPEEYTRRCRRSKRPTPYIYTTDEIRRILIELGSLPLLHSYDAETYKHMVGLIAATGLRLSEAQNILTDDLTGTTILIKDAKFGKSRIVHIHESTALALRRYLKIRPTHLRKDRLFVIHNDRTPSQHSIGHMFRLCTNKLSLFTRHGSNIPRIHDLRHTFAVTSLAACIADRQSVSRHMIALSTYLGHVSISSTYWYLELTMENKMDMALSIEGILCD